MLLTSLEDAWFSHQILASTANSFSDKIKIRLFVLVDLDRYVMVFTVWLPHAVEATHVS